MPTPRSAPWSADRFGEQVVARSVDPMLSGVYAGSAATIGIRAAVPTVAAALDAGAASLTEAVRRALPTGTRGPVFGAIDGGYEVLLNELIQRSRLRWVQTAIEHIAPDGAGWVLRDDEGSHWRADAVVVAVPAPRLAGLVGDVAPRAAAAAARHPGGLGGRGGDGGARRDAVAAAVRGAGGQRRTPARQGDHLVHPEVGRARQRRAAADVVRAVRRCRKTPARITSDDELQAWAVADLTTVFGIDVEPVEVLVHRWLDALPQYGPGHGELAAELRAGLPPTLAVAGNYIAGIGVPACLAVADRAAAAVVAATAHR